MQAAIAQSQSLIRLSVLIQMSVISWKACFLNGKLANGKDFLSPAEAVFALKLFSLFFFFFLVAHLKCPTIISTISQTDSGFMATS